MAITIPAGQNYPVNINGNNEVGETFTPVNVGDLLIYTVFINSATISINSITNNVGSKTWTKAGRFFDSNSNSGYEVWYWIIDGSVTLLSPVGTTVGWSASVATVHTELVICEFHATGSGVWQLLSGPGGLSTSASASGQTLTVFPSETSGAPAEQLYWGYVRNNTTVMVAGSTSGFTYQLTASSNLMCWDLALAANTAFAPNAALPNTSQSVIMSAVGVIFGFGPKGGGMFLAMA